MAARWIKSGALIALDSGVKGTVAFEVLPDGTITLVVWRKDTREPALLSCKLEQEHLAQVLAASWDAEQNG